MTKYSWSQSFKKRNLDQHSVALPLQLPTALVFSFSEKWCSLVIYTISLTADEQLPMCYLRNMPFCNLERLCRKKLSLHTLVVFELSPSHVSLPGPFVLRRLLFTATRRQLKVNCLVTTTHSLRWDLELVRNIPSQSLTAFSFRDT